MKTRLTNTLRWSMVGEIVLPLVIALIFLAFTFSYYPFREKLQFDTDEGLNLMRSMLVTLGHPLYLEVSSDQPPLFTQILGLLFRFTGFEVNPARLLVLLFSTLLVWSAAQFLQLVSGKLAAILFLPLALIIPRYLELSISVMIGVPSIALAVLSMLFVTLWHQKKSNLWLVLSGFTLALSVLTKLFTGTLAPFFLIGIVASVYFSEQANGISWKTLRPAWIWGIWFAGTGILLGLLLVGPQNVGAIILPHITASNEGVFHGVQNTINTFLQAAVPLIILGVIGTSISIYNRKWLMLYPLSWAIFSYILFTFHSPVFYHHQLMITIPAAILAAAGVGEGVLSLTRLKRTSDLIHIRTLLGIGILIGFALVFNHYLPTLKKETMNKPRIDGFTLKATAGKLKILETMYEYADQTNWIMTDMPMYAFRVHKPVPPILATFSQKRLDTGSLTEDDILKAMNEYHPEQVLMARFEIPTLETYLKDHYTLISSEEFFRLFIRDDLAPKVK